MITIMLLTWKELLRKRLMTLTFIMTGLFLVAMWFIAGAITSDLKLIADQDSVDYVVKSLWQGTIITVIGLFFSFFVISFQSIFTSFSAVAGEAEQGVMQALLPRPISRASWYLGRWLGFVTVGSTYALLLFIAILSIANYHASIPRDGTVLIVSALLFMCVVPVLVSMSMLGSTLFSGLGNGILMTMLIFVGWIGGLIERVISEISNMEQNRGMIENITGIMSMIMPVEKLQQRMLAELFSMKEASTLFDFQDSLGPLGLASIPSNSFLLYTLGYTVLALAIGIWRFHRRDL